jgi:predicted phosphodiesterase
MKGPVRILSDLHLGHRVSRIAAARQLRPLLEGVDTVVFNGDTWQELALAFRGDGARLLEELKQMAIGMGVELVFLPGNHDPSCGENGYLELGGGAVLVIHGDAVFGETVPWSRVVPNKVEEIRELYAACPEAAHDLDARLKVAGEVGRLIEVPIKVFGRNLLARAWDAAWPPTRGLRMLWTWRTMVAQTSGFVACFRPAAEVVVFGHFHRAGIWLHGGRLLINTGSFMPPGTPLCVDWHPDGWIRTRPVAYRHGEFVPGASLGVWKVAVPRQD